MQLSQRAGHGNAGGNARQGVPALAARKPPAMSAMRIAQCGGALSAAAQDRRAVAIFNPNDKSLFARALTTSVETPLGPSLWEQGREKLFLAEGFQQSGRSLSRCQRRTRVGGDQYDANALIMQPINQAISPLTASEINVDEGRVGQILGDKAISLGNGRNWSGHVSSAGLEQVFYGCANNR